MSHEFPKTLRGQSKATDKKGHPRLLLPVLVLLPGSSLAAAEDAVGHCRQTWPLPIPVAAPGPLQPIRAHVQRRERRQSKCLRATPSTPSCGCARRAKHCSRWDVMSQRCGVTARCIPLTLASPLLRVPTGQACPCSGKWQPLAHLREPRWRGPKSSRGTLGPRGHGKQSRMPRAGTHACPALASATRGRSGGGSRSRHPGSTAQSLGKSPDPGGLSLDAPRSSRDTQGLCRAAPNAQHCHPRGAQGEHPRRCTTPWQGEDPAVAETHPSKPTPESHPARRGSRAEAGAVPRRHSSLTRGFPGAAASWLPLQSLCFKAALGPHASRTCAAPGAAEAPQGSHPACQAFRGARGPESPRDPCPSRLGQLWGQWGRCSRGREVLAPAVLGTAQRSGTSQERVCWQEAARKGRD